MAMLITMLRDGWAGGDELLLFHHGTAFFDAIRASWYVIAMQSLQSQLANL